MTHAGEENHRNLLRMVDLVQGLVPDSLDFVVLPGDTADDGTPEQFLDMVSAETGRPNFQLTEAQLAWPEHERDRMAAAGQGAAIFMHAYPAEPRERVEPLGTLLARPHVTSR